MTTPTVALLIGATMRLTHLVVADRIAEPFRQWVGKLGPEWAYLIRCDWCSSFWLGPAVFVAGWYAPVEVVNIVAGGLTASLFAGWAANIESAIESLSVEVEVEIEDEVADA